MKVLIAVASCHSLRHYEKSLRDTWIQNIPSEVDFRFFIGNPNTNDFEKDEIFLDVDDGYEGCSAKTIEQSKWVLEHGYDFVYKTDLDTLVVPKNLLSSDFWMHDYTGGKNGEVSSGGSGSPGTGIFASGGSGYWLSKKALSVVAELEHPNPPRADEDVVVAQALKKHGIELHADSRYKWEPRSRFDKDTISFHLTSTLGYNTTIQTAAGAQRQPYGPMLMYKAYENGPQGLSLYDKPLMLVNVGKTRPLRRYRYAE